MPFRPIPEYEGWRADVAFILIDRWERLERNGYLLGAPDLVVEILSPSNTEAATTERERICLENGAREFWPVDLVRHTVRVATATGRITYGRGQSVPLFFGGHVTIDETFQ